MIHNNLYLILANGEKDGIGFWLIDTTFNPCPLEENKDLLECHRKELIGKNSSSNILSAINLNLENLLRDIKKEGYIIEDPPLGISYSLPLDILENIFDFWLDLYKDQTAWDTCLGLLNIKRRLSLTKLINSIGIKGNAKEWAPKIEKLHNYRPFSNTQFKNIEPMWN